MLKLLSSTPWGRARRRFSSAGGVSPTMATGGQRVVDALTKAGVNTVFGIPGTHTVPIYKEMESNKESIHHITTRHESGAGYAADGYARATNDMAAVCVITGVGLTNTITPMAVALADSVPMLVISSQVPSFWSGDRSSRQYSHFVPNIEGIAASVCKPGGSFSVTSAEDIAPTILEACALARSGRPGPVHVSIPVDLLSSTTSAVGLEDTPPVTFPELSAAAHAQLEAAAAALSAAKRPVIIAGGGTAGSSTLLTQLAEALDAPVLSTVAGKGALDERHPLAAGARLHQPLARDHVLDQADALLMLGTQLSPTDYWQFKHDEEVPLQLARLSANAIHVDIDPTSLEQGGVASAGGATILADVSSACGALLTKISPSVGGDGAKVVATAKQLSDDPAAMSSNMMWDFEDEKSGGHQISKTLDALRAALPDDVPLVSDVTRIGYTALSLYESHSPNTFICE
mmetsp:Transcript_46161/g.128647  ORF Transcript_46161/g.128647 Transcript_46161/m.128647 type:complete len:460 (+) Transcript_46161:239-1618(+)